MSLEHIRHMYGYHFRLNRVFWEFCLENLNWEQFIEKSDISVGSLRNQFVHLMSVEEGWFSGFRGVPRPEADNPVHFGKYEKIREKWDMVEKVIRGVLAGLTEEDMEKPFHENMLYRQVLSHVVNHGTAHRAQMGAMLRILGLKPPPQDYIFYVMGRI